MTEERVLRFCSEKKAVYHGPMSRSPGGFEAVRQSLHEVEGLADGCRGRGGEGENERFYGCYGHRKVRIVAEEAVICADNVEGSCVISCRSR